MNGRLYRSRDDRMIAGVAGGLAAHLNIDPSVVRILWVVLVPLTGGLIFLLYLVMAFVVPEQSFGDERWRAWEAQRHGWGPAEDPWDAPAGPGDAWDPDASRRAAFASGPSPDWTEHASEHGSGAGSDDATRAYDPVIPGTSGPAAGPADRASAPLGSDTNPLGPMPGGFGAPARGASAGLGPTAAVPPGAAAPTGPPFSTPHAERRAPWPATPPRGHDGSAPLVFGVILVLIGAFFLARAYLPDIDWEASWPLLLVAIGVALLVGSVRRGASRS